MTTQLVSLRQAAELVGRAPSTLEGYRKGYCGRTPVPEPAVPARGCRPHLWDWRALRPWLEGTFGLALPERSPLEWREPPPAATSPGEGALLTGERTAALLTLSLRTVMRMVAAGQFPAPIRFGGRTVRWRPDDVRAYLARLAGQRQPA